MAERTISIGNLRNIVVYNDEEFPDGVVTPSVLITQAPSSDQHAARVRDLNGGTLDPVFNSVTVNGVFSHRGQQLELFGSGVLVSRPPSVNQLGGTAGGTVDGSIQVLTDPADLPLTADALRDDLVANLIPQLRNNIEELQQKINELAAVLNGFFGY